MPPPAWNAGRFWLMLGLYLAWIAGLIALAARTSNPPQLNLLQVSRATLIVTAVVEDLSAGRCRVERSFSPGPPPKEIVVTNLSQTPAASGKTYLLPLARDLRRDDDGYRIVDVPDKGIPPLVYPAGPEIEAQLQRWQQPGR